MLAIKVNPDENMDVVDRMGMRETVERYFTPYDDGWSYPCDPARALVRIEVYGGAYTLQRRRNLHTRWQVIAVRDEQDFDAAMFVEWYRSARLSV